jgi:hypothetical protein
MRVALTIALHLFDWECGHLEALLEQLTSHPQKAIGIPQAEQK